MTTRPFVSQPSLFTVDSDWCPPSALPSIPPGVPVVVDVETKDPGIQNLGPGWADLSRGGYITGVALAWGPTEAEATYLPVRHPGGGCLDQGLVQRYLRDLLHDRTRPVIAHSAQYDLGWLATWDLFPTGPIYDTLLQTSLLDEYRWSYALNACLKYRLKSGKDETLLRQAADAYGLGPKDGLWALPARFVGPYATADAFETWRLHDAQQQDIALAELTTAYDRERQLPTILVAMRRRGVRINVDLASATRHRLLAQEQALVKALGGCDIWSGASVAKRLRAEGIQPPATPTGADSITKGWLASLKHPVAAQILQARQVNKLRTVFIESYLLNQVDQHNRLHGEFHQLRSDDGGAETGRFSSSHPNLQNLPARGHAEAKMIRKFFLPEDGCDWVAADYSQQEPRLVVHYAETIGAPGARDAAEAYRQNPDTDFYAYLSGILQLERTPVKIISLGLFYGMGGAKLCHSLGLPTVMVERQGKLVEVAGPEGQALLDGYHANAPFVRTLSDRATRLAEQRGHLRTLGGRLARFTRNDGRDKRAFAYKALNRLIQGSAADQLKEAVLLMAAEGILPHVLVHDETGSSAPDPATRARIRDCMLAALPLRIPSKVDLEVGPSWGDAA